MFLRKLLGGLVCLMMGLGGAGLTGLGVPSSLRSTLALAYESPGEPVGYVSDFAGILSNSTRTDLNNKLDQFEKNTSNQIFIATVGSLDGETVSYFANKLFEEWGVGQADKDNGVLLLIAPNERKLWIEVGYGLEGALTDYEVSIITNQILFPAFKNEDYDGGVLQAVDAIMTATNGEYVGDGTSAGNTAEEDPLGTIMFIIIFTIWGIGLFSGMIASAALTKSFWPGGFIGGFAGYILSILFSVLGWMSVIFLFTVPGILIGLGIDLFLSRAKILEGWRKKLKEEIKNGRNGKGGFFFWGSGGRGGGGFGGGGFGGGGFGGGGGGASGGGGGGGGW